MKMRYRISPEVPSPWLAIFGSLGTTNFVGDTTNQADVARLIAWAKQPTSSSPTRPITWTTKATQKTTSKSRHRMSDADFKQFLETAFRSYRTVAKPRIAVHRHPPHHNGIPDALETAGFEVRCQIIWAKNTFAWGFGRYKFQHEPMFYAHVAGQKDPWYGDKSQSTLWQENKPAANRLHPTMKPVELI